MLNSPTEYSSGWRARIYLMIPKVLHYCFGMSRDFGRKPWSLVHYVCLRSAVERLRPEKVLLYFEYEPTGPWWKLSRELVTLVPVKAPRRIFGNPVIHSAHRSDIVRLERLLEIGGIYLDADVFVHRDFDDLLHAPHCARKGRVRSTIRPLQRCNLVRAGSAFFAQVVRGVSDLPWKELE